MIYEDINGLIQKAVTAELIDTSDRIYVRNQILPLLNLDSFPETIKSESDDSIADYLEKIISYAVEKEVIEDVFDDKEILSANIMNCFIPLPSIINEKFQQYYSESPKKATDYFYELSKNSNYIQLNRTNKNIEFKTDTEFGELDITINMSKPEKDPEQIRREREQKHSVDYPKCLLCLENEGYNGRTGYPARSNHRVIKVPLLNENWYLQYSPYVYYKEHSIVFSEEHRPMKINKRTLENLLLFIEKFPHYFIGSNADLPIVGGSILNHEHYQAGRYHFPMEYAENAISFDLKNWTSVSASVLKWPLTTVRLQSRDKTSLLETAEHILETWKTYHDEVAEIVPSSGKIPHNTITPIARMHNDEFQLDLVLRNNRTSEQHPLGMFHPHADVHHIKRENIGLIEVMGLAVLPARLKDELAEMKKFLLDQPNTVADYHQEWAHQLKNKYGKLSNQEQTASIIEKELGTKFAKALNDAGVLKNTDAVNRFIDKLNK